MSWLVSFKNKPLVHDCIYFSTKWSFIILNLVCTQTHRKLGLHCNIFVFPKIKKKYCPLSVNMGLMLSLLHPAPALCLLTLISRRKMLHAHCFVLRIIIWNLYHLAFFFNIAGSVYNKLVSKYQLLVNKAPFSQCK